MHDIQFLLFIIVLDIFNVLNSNLFSQSKDTLTHGPVRESKWLEVVRSLCEPVLADVGVGMKFSWLYANELWRRLVCTNQNLEVFHSREFQRILIV